MVKYDMKALFQNSPFVPLACQPITKTNLITEQEEYSKINNDNMTDDGSERNKCTVHSSDCASASTSLIFEPSYDSLCPADSHSDTSPTYSESIKSDCVCDEVNSFNQISIKENVSTESNCDTHVEEKKTDFLSNLIFKTPKSTKLVNKENVRNFNRPISKSAEKVVKRNKEVFKTPEVVHRYPGSSKKYNVESPIAKYIHETVNVPLRRNIAIKTTERPKTNVNIDIKTNTNILHPTHLSNIEYPPLPLVVYKPAKCLQLTSKKIESKLPKNIERAMKAPLRVEVVQHTGRINTNDTEVTESKLVNKEIMDLSNTVNSSTSNVPPNTLSDVSMRVTTYAKKSFALNKHI